MFDGKVFFALMALVVCLKNAEVTEGKYLGCFKDKTNRAIKGFEQKNNKALTTSACIRKCASMDFLYAGTQMGTYCFCGNSYNKYGKAPERMCLMRCSGNLREVCGGKFKNTVYSTGVIPIRRKYIGCYKDKPGNSGAIKGYTHVNDPALSIDKCVRVCTSLKYLYAGTQGGKRCYCGNSYDKYGKAPDRSCSSRCVGNHAEICGGHLKISVYSTGIKHRKLTYVGCYNDRKGRPALNGHRQTGMQTLSLPLCIQKCQSLKFLYAGTQLGTQCYCGNSYNKYGKTWEKSCSYACSGNHAEKCGGNLKNSVYATGTKSARRKYIGCYIDKNIHAMKGFKDRFNTALSVEWCVRKCAALNFKNAGLQFSTCYCGNNYDRYGKADEKSCSIPCSGNPNEICGGPFRNSVYSTGIDVKEWTYIGCYKDTKSKRAMKGLSQNDNHLTIKGCVLKCQSLNFLYAGTQSGRTCYCGNSYSKHGEADERTCSVKCNGNHEEICGGILRNSVFATGLKTKERKYMGCYKDTIDRAMKGFKESHNTELSIESCIWKCAARNFRYAGMQFKTECFCDNSYDKYGKADDKTCSSECSGNHAEICGGAWRNSVYSTGLTSQNSTYLGCYRDSGYRAMKGFQQLNNPKLTLKGCIKKCASLNLLYAGTQAGKRCFCSNSYARYGRVAEKSCSSRCSGNPIERCGGSSVNSVFSTGVITVNRKYIGCYRDRAKRAVNGFAERSNTELSIEVCIRKCSLLNFQIAAMQYGKQCFCGYNYNAYGKAKDETCSMKCSGNPAEICGGPWANSVYATGIKLKRWRYIGCYKDSSYRAMRGFIQTNILLLTTEQCIQKCASRHFLYAGTQAGTSCVCGNSYDLYGKDKDASCSKPCSGNHAELCGGSHKNSVFSTGIASIERKYIGCYVDKAQRAMNGIGRYVRHSLSVEKCVRKCSSLNYPYAGLQRGVYCFCDYAYDIYGRADERQCSSRCSGNHAEICGGSYRNSVYTSGLPVLRDNPVVKVRTKGGSIKVVCYFPALKNDNFMYAIIWNIGENKITMKVRGEETSVSLRQDELLKLKIGDKIYVKLYICVKGRCDSTMSTSYQSNVLHTDMGIPDSLTLEEGKKRPVEIILNPIFPPSFWCGSQDCNMTIYSYFTPKSELECFGTTVYQAVIAENDKPCGIEFTPDNWKTERNLSIRATDDGLVEKKTVVRDLKIFAEYRHANGDIKTVTVKTVRVTIMDFAAGPTKAFCKSVNDPHMTTFDGTYYNNLLQGDFILYRNTELHQEIQVFFRTCLGKASCNCAVAARAGDDVIVIDICGPNRGAGFRPAQLLAYVNGEMTRGFEIRSFASGRRYYIYFPTGTYVDVLVGSNFFLNVWVRPSTADYENTEGLCGSFDSNRGNDFMRRFHNTLSKNHNEFSTSWRPLPTEIIYGGYCPKKGEKHYSSAAADNRVYCDCLAGRKPSCELNLQVFKCKDSQQTKNQKKRQGEDVTKLLLQNALKPVGCSPGEETRQFDFDKQAKEKIQKCPTPRGMTERKAKNICMNEINRIQAGRACKMVESKILARFLRNCKQDLCMTENKLWAVSELRDLETECKLKEDINTNLWKPNKNGTLIPNPKIEGIICINDCCQHGKCSGGLCQCENDFMSDDCSVRKKDPPDVTNIEGNAFCDEKCKSCKTVIIAGRGFVHEAEPVCHITEQEDANKTTTYTVSANFITFQMVSCDLKRAISCKISISNRDGKQSKQLSYTVYDSSCKFCSKEGCFKRNDVCVIGGRCYKAGTTSRNDKTKICLPNVNTGRWTSVETGRKRFITTTVKLERLNIRTLDTTIGSFAVSGTPALVKNAEFGHVLEIQTAKDFFSAKYIEKIACLTNVVTCKMGFMLEFSVRVQKFCDNMIFVSSGGELRAYYGMALYYKQGNLIATVDTPAKKWTASTKFNTLNTFVKLTLSWSISDGMTFLVNSKTIRKSDYCEGKERIASSKVSNMLRIGRSIDGSSACPGKMQIGGIKVFPAFITLIETLKKKIVDGRWSNWSKWSVCSKKCGGGIKTRTRKCNNPAPSDGGTDCYGDASRTENCNKKPCIVDGRWSQWSKWSPCSKKCGGGIKMQKRSCTNPAPLNGGKDCHGKRLKTIICNRKACEPIIKGKWGAWEKWTACSAQCGWGIKVRARECYYPAKSRGKPMKCPGRNKQYQFCKQRPCPEKPKPISKGRWGTWQAWNKCSVKCGRGLQVRVRECLYPVSSSGRRIKCVGKSEQPRYCRRPPCSTKPKIFSKGKWGPWKPWTACSKKCGGGIQSATRECFYPAPYYGKRIKCAGRKRKVRRCNPKPCKKKPKCVEIPCKSETADFFTCHLPSKAYPMSMGVLKNYGSLKCSENPEDNWGIYEDQLWIDVGCSGLFKICYKA